MERFDDSLTIEQLSELHLLIRWAQPVAAAHLRRCQLGLITLADALRAFPWVAEAVPGDLTLAIECTVPGCLHRLQRCLAVGLPPSSAHAPRQHTIAVRYGGEFGPDLGWVAKQCGCDEQTVIRRHTQGKYWAAFVGFQPGFAYLEGLPPELHLPRRATPRLRVEPGSVALASHYGAIYPAASPGGWHIIGHTDLALFSPSRTPPALIQPGDEVQFVEESRHD
ncbi:sensor histidine kinase inhibitor, KipI family [Ferrimonas sediminum]|uniref:Sensor histidine kinase inhibitor, KipI family n=1 Tax=Ferrimonas sediminum TaxID=718193 RepID=A0A1G8SB76_9GAMM|nr:5-oxoprolinase subunit PxpB [Ferrimonas sediminum]SDJ26478.1 sensor histidine kinase inhibitor, KipI family [Ferrimonas sediminum]